MAGKKKKSKDRPVYESIRKPTAAPSRKFEKSAVEEREYPSRRRAKHKKKVEVDE